MAVYDKNKTLIFTGGTIATSGASAGDLAAEIAERESADSQIRGGVQQGAIVSLVNQAASVTEGNTLITADIAPASVSAGLSVAPAGTKVLLRVPSVIEGELSLQVTGDTARAIRTERNTDNATADDVEAGGYIIMVKLSGQWVIQSGAFGSETIRDIKSSLSLMGAVDGFVGARTGGYLAKGNGTIASASASWTYTDFVPVTQGQVIRYVGQINRDQGAAIAFYDSNQAYVGDGLVADPAIPGNLQTVTGTVTVPAGVAFIRAATLNTVAHSLTYIPTGSTSPEAFAESVISTMEHAAGTEKLRLQAALNALLSGSALPSKLANLPGAGDSFTVGANATSPANRYLNRVAAALGATVTNYGQGGRVLQNSAMENGQPQTNNFRDRFRSIFTGAEKKDFALIAYGFNDARYTAAPTTFNVAEYQNDYREVLVGLMCEGYRRDQILVVGPHYITDVGLETGSDGFTGQTRAGFEAYVTAAQDVAEEFGVLYFDSYAYMRDNGGASLIDTDDIHPNNTGHEVIATGIIEETTVLNQRNASTVIDFRSTPDAILMAWTPVAGAVSYDYTFVEYDTLDIPSVPVNTSGTSAEMSTAPLGLKAVLIVRPVFSDGAGPWSASSPVDV